MHVVGDKALAYVSILLYVDIIGVNSYVTFIDNNSITDNKCSYTQKKAFFEKFKPIIS